MSPESLNRTIQAELDRLEALGLLTPEARVTVGQRYPTGLFDLTSLARWFTILGAVAAACGLALLVHDLAGMWLALEGGQAILAAGLLVGGQYLRHRRAMEKTGAALELLGTMALQGLLTTLAVHHSRHSGNWPALVGVLTVTAAVVAYTLKNRLVLVLAGVMAFVWFGGSTGYASGWGVWWLGMTYPLRFLVAGLAFLAVAYGHARLAPPPWQGFSRVYTHLGLLDLHLALWFLSVFGWFTEMGHGDRDTFARLAFTTAWGAVSLGCVLGSGRLGLQVIRSYGLTFLLINVYTFYFQFVVWNSPEAWFVHLLVTGGALVGGGTLLERTLKPRPSDASASR